MRVLYIIPDSVADSTAAYLGSTKDCQARLEYFDARGISYELLYAEQRSDERVCQRLKQIDLKAFEAALFEFPLYPKAMAWLRQRAPHLRLMVRSHNAELFHRLHYLAAGILTGANDRKLTALRQQLRYGFHRLQLDRVCARLADLVLSISDWEARFYWRYITDPRKVISVPFFLAERYLPWSETEQQKQATCVCMTSPHITPFVLDAAQNFGRAVAALGDRLPDWNFYLTGDLTGQQVAMPSRIHATGLLATPYSILHEARAMASLSNYGFGFKTKLLEAVMSQCRVLVTGGLFRRLPSALLPYCLIVNPRLPGSFCQALERCWAPFPNGNPNTQLREQAFRALDSVFDLTQPEFTAAMRDR